MTTHTLPHAPSAQPRHRNEPVAMQDATVTTGDLQACLAAWDAKRAGDPDGWFVPGVCKHCGASLGETPDDRAMSIGAYGFLPNVCCASCSDAGKKRIEDEEKTMRQQRFYAGHIPDEFFTWDTERGNNEALAKAKRVFSFSARRNLVLQGTTGTGKSRIAWELVKVIVEQPEGFSFCWLDSFDAATKGIPVEAVNAAFLFIDDLGNEPTSTKFETALLQLIRKRCDWHRPFVITTQLTPRAFGERFFQGVAAEAIMRRMRERTDTVLTNGSR